MNKFIPSIIIGSIGSIILCLTIKIFRLELELKRINKIVYSFTRDIEYETQCTNDRFTVLSSNISTILKYFYQIEIIDDEDLDRINSVNNSELLERFKDTYGEKEGKRRFDIYINRLDEVVDLTFYKNMN